MLCIFQVPLHDGCLSDDHCPDQPWLQRHDCSLDDINRSLNEDDLQECVSEQHLDTAADSDTRPIPNTGVYNGECASGVEPQNTGRVHRGNGHGGDRASYTSHAPQATSLGHSEQHRAGHGRRDVGSSRSPRQATTRPGTSPTHRLNQPRTVVT